MNVNRWLAAAQQPGVDRPHRTHVAHATTCNSSFKYSKGPGAPCLHVHPCSHLHVVAHHWAQAAAEHRLLL